VQIKTKLTIGNICCITFFCTSVAVGIASYLEHSSFLKGLAGSLGVLGGIFLYFCMRWEKQILAEKRKHRTKTGSPLP
jgi:hypothetical protein